MHDITPAGAGWSYVGFGLYRIGAEETVAERTGERETLLVLVEGRAEITAGGESFGELGARLDVFERTKPWSAYVPNASDWTVRARTACTLAVCTAPGEGGHPACVIGPDAVVEETRGTGANSRHIHSIAMEQADVADRLLVTEVYTPPGNWSSYPPHRHDEDDFPNITYLEETYYHRVNPVQGFGIQRVFTEDGIARRDDGGGGPRRGPGAERSPSLRRPLRLRALLPERHGRTDAQVAVQESPRPRVGHSARSRLKELHHPLRQAPPDGPGSDVDTRNPID